MTSESTPTTSEVEITTADGRTLRYSRYLNSEGTAWVRHGTFREHFQGGRLASEGQYLHGKESGQWRDFYPSGQLAAEGVYEDGAESGWWRFWDSSGSEERKTLYEHGVEVSSG